MGGLRAPNEMTDKNKTDFAFAHLIGRIRMNKLNVLTIVAATLAVAATAPPVDAQTATDLNCKFCVHTRDIAKGAVANRKIMDGTIMPVKLRTPTGGAFEHGADLSNIVDDTTVVSLTVTIPGPGVVIINTSGYVRFDGADGQISCSIRNTPDPTSGEPFVRANGSNAGGADARQVISATRGFTEGTEGTYTYRFVCDVDTNGIHNFYEPYMTAIYVPVSIQ